MLTLCLGTVVIIVHHCSKEGSILAWDIISEYYRAKGMVDALPVDFWRVLIIQLYIFKVFSLYND